MKLKSFYSIFLILFILLGSLLIYQNYRLRKDLYYSKKILEFSKNPYIDLMRLEQIINNHIVKNNREDEMKWSLVIIFSPEACPYCLEEIDYWLDFSEKKDNLECWGLVDHPHKELVLSFIESMEWKFTNLCIEDSRLGENFNLGKFPIKVLLDENNRIFYVERTLLNWEKESILKKMIEDLKLD